MDEPPRKLKKRQKLCHNCEGEIDLEVIVCPFCAADLREEKPEQGRISFGGPQRLGQEKFQSESVPPPSYIEPRAIAETLLESPIEDPAPLPREQNFLTPTILFTLGVQLVLIGLLMLLFSHKGTIHLTWDASWWFVYCVIGFPFLYFGYRAISRL